MTFQGAVIKEQGVTFALVVVKKHVIDNKTQANNMIKTFQQSVFRGKPVVLMAQNHRGRPTYYGRRDISRFMASVPLRAVRWKKYSLS